MTIIIREGTLRKHNGEYDFGSNHKAVDGEPYRVSLRWNEETEMYEAYCFYYWRKVEQVFYESRDLKEMVSHLNHVTGWNDVAEEKCEECGRYKKLGFDEKLYCAFCDTISYVRTFKRRGVEP